MSEKDHNERDGDYLWDKSGEPDAEIQKLEGLLAGFAHDERELRQRRGQLRRGRRWFVMIGAAVAGLLAVVGIYAYFGDATSQDAGSGVQLMVVSENRPLLENEWFDATPESRELRLENSEAWLGEFILDPGSRLQARTIRDDLAQLYLNNGRMEAFVYLDAHPRLVQTATPATNCVDLGCKYTLTVDAEGNSSVVVTMGRVAFEDRGREVYVPHGATCRASKAYGSGTPRYLDAPKPLTLALDAFDASHDKGADERIELCKAVLDAVPKDKLDDQRHCLSVFHLLQDRDPAVEKAARDWLVANVVPRSLVSDRARMRQYLEDTYWWK